LLTLVAGSCDVQFLRNHAAAKFPLCRAESWLSRFHFLDLLAFTHGEQNATEELADVNGGGLLASYNFDFHWLLPYEERANRPR